ncbi:hypothetical protein [Paenibacillus arenosi]|uniref:Motility protein B-like N-terminal domain-containing protein n=1 Tax=Paenibacillus arenosi TaxID=2774142 RepID=A0ABR9AY09_9BACL|nr:hypothetical protein [Paenibacillus arenosi]MBD8499033.1 hypothetical protein [Paenibacillus arenosi]
MMVSSGNYKSKSVDLDADQQLYTFLFDVLALLLFVLLVFLLLQAA